MTQLYHNFADSKVLTVLFDTKSLSKLLNGHTCRSCDQHFNSCEQLKVHVCKSSSEAENYNERGGKAVGEAEERGGDGEVIKGERTGELQKPESVRANNDIHRLLGNDNLLIKGVASDKVEGTEERTPSLHEKREYSVLYETEDNRKDSDTGR